MTENHLELVQIQPLPVERLAELLIVTVAKGDPVDVGNFAMMLFCRHEDHDALRTAATSPVAPMQHAAPLKNAYVKILKRDRIYILRRRRIRNLSKQLLIQEGPLPENGVDKIAERNGLSLAANIISSMIGHEEQANPAPPVAEHDSSDTVRIDWLDAQDHIHALQWHCGNRGAPVKTSFYDRNRALIAEGISLRHAIDAAMQPQTEKGE
jgi:hypothetical protein